MSLLDGLSAALGLLGALFFAAGTVGLLRFPDPLSRLHAVSKANNTGLGLTVVGLALDADSGWVVLKLLLVWGLALVTGGPGSEVTARAAIEPRRPAGGAGA